MFDIDPGESEPCLGLRMQTRPGGRRRRPDKHWERGQKTASASASPDGSTTRSGDRLTPGRRLYFARTVRSCHAAECLQVLSGMDVLWVQAKCVFERISTLVGIS